MSFAFFFKINIGRGVDLRPITLWTRHAIRANFFNRNRRRFRQTIGRIFIDRGHRHEHRAGTIVYARHNTTHFGPFTVGVELSEVFHRIVRNIIVFLQRRVRINLWSSQFAVFRAYNDEFAGRSVACLVTFSVRAFLFYPAGGMFDRLLFVVKQIEGEASFNGGVPRQL